jgi:chromosome segregation ATPase
MKTNELLMAMERGFADLRSEMAGRFEQIDGRFEQIDGRFDQMDGRFEQMDGRFEQMDGRFEQMDRHFEKNDGRLDGLEKGVRELGALFEDFQDNIARLSEGIETVNEKLDRHREETAKGFDDLRGEIRANTEPLRLRIEALEERCP